jgi:hypothetical protein
MGCCANQEELTEYLGHRPDERPNPEPAGRTGPAAYNPPAPETPWVGPLTKSGKGGKLFPVPTKGKT